MNDKTIEETIAETWPNAERMESAEAKPITPEEAAAIMEAQDGRA